MLRDFESDHYKVLITAPNQKQALGDDKPIRGVVLIAVMPENVGNLKFGVARKLTGLDYWREFEPDSIITLTFPVGTVLSEWAIIGPNVGDGVRVAHGGGWS
jgi:hypothetical protein